MQGSSSSMDPQFEELARHIADDVEKRFSKRFEEAEERLEERLAKRVANDVDARFVERFQAVEARLSAQFTGAEERLANGAKMHMEELRSMIKVTAEGYGATLDRIDRQLAELNAKFDTKFGDHDKVLLDHASRISALERSQ